MKNLESNKIAAAILVAGLLALASGKIADFLYHPTDNSEKRGFTVEVAETNDEGTAAEKEEEVIDIAALMAAANAANGAKIYKKCAACHGYEKGGPNKVGPNLHGVVGASKAAHSDYAYSDAMKEKGGNWTTEELFDFLKKPGKYLPGTKMTFAGIRKPEQIADLIAFLSEQK